MKIVALGGCGQEGRTAVRALLSDPLVSELRIADLNEAAGAAFASELSDDRVSACRIDVSDRESLVGLIRGADVVANFVGPYYLFGRSTLEAAIEAGVNYVDINDDTDATAECLELDGAARAAGVAAVIGLGASPGLSNVLARAHFDVLTSVERLDIRWQVSITDVDQTAGVSAALLHFLHAVHGDVPQFIDGRLQQVPAWSGEETVEFASIGSRQAFFTAHPEPWTLARSLPSVPTITCKGGVAGLDEAVPLLQAIGLTSDDPIEVGGQMVSPRLIALALLGRMPDPDPLPPPVSGLLVTARGSLDGRRVERRSEVMAPSRMTLLTGLPTAVGVSLVARGEDVPRGAMPPELAFRPAPFLERLQAFGVEIRTEQVELDPCS